MKELQNDGDEEEGNVAPEDILQKMEDSQHEIDNEVSFLSLVSKQDKGSLTKDTINEYKNKLLNEFKYNLDTFEKVTTIQNIIG